MRLYELSCVYSSEVHLSWFLNSLENYTLSVSTCFIVETPVVATECCPVKMFSAKLQTHMNAEPACFVMNEPR